MKIETDYKLVKAKDYYGLFEKYKPLVMKYYQKMKQGAPVVFSASFEDFNDFQGWCYQYFVAAFDSVDLNKIKHPDTWTFWYTFNGFLHTYTKRFIKKFIENYISPVSTDILETYDYDEIKTTNLYEVLQKLSEKDQIKAYKIMHGDTRYKLSKKGQELLKKELLIL